jgi:hypothetical protein
MVGPTVREQPRQQNDVEYREQHAIPIQHPGIGANLHQSAAHFRYRGELSLLSRQQPARGTGSPVNRVSRAHIASQHQRYFFELTLFGSDYVMLTRYF